MASETTTSASGEEAAIDRACESDRLWFKHHPGHSHRVRQRVAGEFGPHEAEAGPGPLVVVTQVRPGLRLRTVATLLEMDVES